MTIGNKWALFIGGMIFGSAGFKILASRDARKAYTHITAASLRCKDEVMRNVELVQESCSDILADAKQINEKRRQTEEAGFIEDRADTTKNEPDKECEEK